MFSTSSSAADKTKKLAWAHWFALANIILACAISTIYLLNAPGLTSLAAIGYAITTWLGHIGFITFVGFVIAVLPLCYLIKDNRNLRAISSALAALGLTFLSLDALVYTQTGLHIDLSTSPSMWLKSSQMQGTGKTAITLYSALMYLLWLVVQLVTANLIWKRLFRLSRSKVSKQAIILFVACFCLSQLSHIIADARLYRPILAQDNVFPLSYPATAKTLMAQFGLLDLENYEQRRSLIFSPQKNELRYPKNPFFCVLSQPKDALIILTQQSLKELSGTFNEHPIIIAPNRRQSALNSMVFGLPEHFSTNIKQQVPVLTTLAESQGIRVSIVSEQPLEGYIASYRTPLQTLQLKSDRGHLRILVTDQLDHIERAIKLHQRTSSNGLMMLVQQQHSIERNSQLDQDLGSEISPIGRLFTNAELKPFGATIEDLVPTLLGYWGCEQPSEDISTGQNLLSPRRQWLVSSYGQGLIVVNQQQLAIIERNGSYVTYDLATLTRDKQPLELAVLSRAIKLLDDYTR